MVSTAARSNMPRLPSLIVRFLTLKICARRIFDVTGQPPVGVSLPALQRARRRNLQSRLDIGKRPNCCSSSLGVGRTEMDTNLTRYREPNHVRSMVEIAITFVPLATLWVLALPICLSCDTGCRLVCSSAAGSLG